MDLSPAEKTAWLYLVSMCDNVGVWAPNTRLADFQIGEKVNWESLRENCNGNIIVLENGKWWLCEFCTFQHPDLDENSKSNAVQSYVQLLKHHGLFQQYMNSTGRVHVPSKERDREQVQVKVKEREGEKSDIFENDFDTAWSHYPRKTNRKGAYKAYIARRREGIESGELELAAANYAAQVKADGTEEQYMMHGATFFGPNERWKEAKPVKQKINNTSVKSWTCSCGKVNTHSGGYCLACKKDKPSKNTRSET